MAHFDIFECQHPPRVALPFTLTLEAGRGGEKRERGGEREKERQGKERGECSVCELELQVRGGKESSYIRSRKLREFACAYLGERDCQGGQQTGRL